MLPALYMLPAVHMLPAVVPRIARGSLLVLPSGFRNDIMKPAKQPVPTFKLGTYLQVRFMEKKRIEYEPVRFNEMQRYLKKIADKTLSQNLKELEADGLITRTVYPQIPPKVEYTLTKRGHSLVKVLDGLCDWGNENRR